MDGRFNNHPFVSEQEDLENSPENSSDLTPSAMFNDSKMTSTSSPKRSSRRAVQKRVVSVPIRDVEGSRLKCETSAPPADSWAWRKYGQKPIKGSPYPRGYYRCSSSKGCPARKQVERSHVDPTMLVVTYSCEHNHPWPAAKNNQGHNNNHNHNHNQNQDPLSTTSIVIEATTTTNDALLISEGTPIAIANQSKLDPSEKFVNLGEESLIINSEFGWFCDLDSTSSTMLESPILTDDKLTDADMTMIFSMREEDESLFADLGELPECSRVFQRGVMEREEERRRCSLTPWCGTTG
ncbi:unnamed protein product [Ilex paraguariensis]|uniref:WRKY domain-containing protein n=1 Tax=Ilex paraguariensis TaxID=185542 RepID=A0ABC8S5Y2_9AQUA